MLTSAKMYVVHDLYIILIFNSFSARRKHYRLTDFFCIVFKYTFIHHMFTLCNFLKIIITLTFLEIFVVAMIKWKIKGNMFNFFF